MDIINLIAKSSLQLMMVKPGTNVPTAFGSGCIVRYKERWFLLSVAHVTDIDGLATCIETNQQSVDLQTPVYSVGAMCYFDQYKIPKSKKIEEIKGLEDLLVNYNETLDITFCEIKENITLLQPEWDFGTYKIEKGEKVFLNLEEAGLPEIGKLYGLCGRVRQNLNGIQLQVQPTMKLDLQFKGTKGRFHYFIAPELITDVDDYRGCSGAPILDEDGKLVALTSSVMKNTKVIFGFSIEECKRLLDLAIETKLV